MDPTAQFKENQKVAWSSFAVFESMTGSVAPRLASFAGIKSGASVLDVGCGTGVVGLTAARLGARVTGVDLTPELIARAKENSALMGVAADWRQGDVEALPLPDASFDFVVSQFGHMFAPRPEVAVREMLRVLKRGGVIAFSTWPPEMLVGRMFAVNGKYAPPPPPGTSPPGQWGDIQTIRERLGVGVTDIRFARDVMVLQMLSPQHYRVFMETSGPAKKLLEGLDKSDPAKAAAFRRDLEQLAAEYFEDNALRQDFLLTRAVKV